MTADDLAQKRQALAVLTLLEASFKIGRKFKVCPTCLIYAAADATQDAEERGDAVHGMCDTPEYIHPPHKTVL
jgi:hypothetical protein